MTYGLPDSVVVGTAKRVGSYIDRKERGNSSRIDANAERLEHSLHRLDSGLASLAAGWGGLAGWRRLFALFKRRKKA